MTSTKTKSIDPKVVVIGGGTGSFTLLSSLKHFTKNLTAVVNMVDDGGSTGKLRDELGALPPGDVRQCLVALSNAPEYLRELFNFRFEKGTLAGHSFGNLFITAFEQMNDSFADSVNIVSKVLNVQGTVLPVTLEDTILEMTLDGNKVTGQAKIEDHNFDGSKRPKMSLKPKAKLNPRVKSAILAADIVVIAPGNLYSSLVPVLITEGLDEVLARTDAKVVQVANLVNKPTQTNGLTVGDYLEIIGGAIGGVEHIDALIYNDSNPPEGLLDKYANSGELPVEVEQGQLDNAGVELIAEALISNSPVERADNDSLMTSKRNFIRHDADKVSELILGVLDD